MAENAARETAAAATAAVVNRRRDSLKANYI
jgi:hypothetical protein